MNDLTKHAVRIFIKGLEKANYLRRFSRKPVIEFVEQPRLEPASTVCFSHSRPITMCALSNKVDHHPNFLPLVGTSGAGFLGPYLRNPSRRTGVVSMGVLDPVSEGSQMDQKLAKELVKTRKAVKQKYLTVKSDIAATERELQQQFKPISEPFQKLLSKVEGLKQELQIKEEQSTPPSVTSTPKKRQSFNKELSENLYQRYLPPVNYSFLEDAYSNLPEPHRSQDVSTVEELTPNATVFETENQQINESVARVAQEFHQLIDTPAYQEYLEGFHPVPRKYVDESIRGNEREFDRYYGLTHDIVSDKFQLGKSPVTLDGANIVVENVTYPGTPGLYELLFKKEPIGYKQSDLDHCRIKMPIDKFGRQMLRSKKTDTAAIFSTFLRSNLSSVCVVPIYSSTSSEQFYTFKDKSKDYIVHVTGIVDSINVPPKLRVTIGLNSLTDNTPLTKGYLDNESSIIIPGGCGFEDFFTLLVLFRPDWVLCMSFFDFPKFGNLIICLQQAMNGNKFNTIFSFVGISQDVVEQLMASMF
ncbi:unnamed protein product [Acanthoscelides obtectus]|uniref:DUF8207 domain-containing protein n=1 Tax=Acanthoscelides obtectus TaxID=200917 RepID=A0A9P0KA83_ACAOB|nr:unnamed protein product [Acanthoscelides obtectus]